MNRLLKIGFACVGNWTLTDTYQLVLNLRSNNSSKNVLYSFVSNGIIKYIGKSIQKLEDRLYGYKNPGNSQSTNIRVNKQLIDQLKQGHPIDILILNDNGHLSFGEFKINIAAGLEDALIYEISPDWNYSGKKKIIDDEQSISTSIKYETKNEKLSVSNVFEVKIGQTYLKQGFFNVPVSHTQLFGENGSEIEVFLGTKGKVIIGYINRRANLNNTPRIMGSKDLKIFFQEYFKLNDNMRVKINSPVSIEITK
jgi:hypothetical protein